MILLIHILRQIKNLIKFPSQFLKVLLSDIRKDFFNKDNKNFEKVLVIGLPKSGTTLIEWLLAESGYVNQAVSPLRIFYDKGLKNSHDLSFKMLNYIPKNKSTFLKRHSEATKENIDLIKKFNVKLIISKRNLRDTMISRYLHLISDSDLPHNNQLIKFNYINGFKKSLIIHPMNKKPIKEYYDWTINWEAAIKQKKIKCLLLDYDTYKKDKKIYINKILKYLNLKKINTSELIQKHNIHLNKLKKNSLKDNLKKYLHAQTFNPNFDFVKQKLKKKFSKSKFNDLIKNHI